MDAIGANLQAVRLRIANAAADCGRCADDVGLVAVSKGFGAGCIVAAYAHGQRAFGESYVQEALAKMPAAEQHCAALAPADRPSAGSLESRIAQTNREIDPASSAARGHSAGVASAEGPLLRPLESRIAQTNREIDPASSDARGHSAGVASPEGPLLRPLEWHFIGPIQSNKTRAIAERFAWAHSVDRLKIAERLSAARPAGAPPLQVCIQINIGGEETKSGVAPGDAVELARAVAALPRLRLRGLMAVPPPAPDRATQRRHFALLRQLKDRLLAAGIALDTLSMGMSADLEAAIAEGATLVRVGTAIFGERKTVKSET